MVMVVLFLNAGKDHIKNKVAMAISKRFFFFFFKTHIKARFAHTLIQNFFIGFLQNSKALRNEICFDISC